MTLTDTIHESYLKIYQGISNYKYSIEQYTLILKSMISLQKVIYSLNVSNEITEKEKRKIEEICKEDFIKAYRGKEYC